MTDEIDYPKIEQAEKELQQQLEQERHPRCPACGSPNTRRRNSIVSLLLITVTLAQMVFLFFSRPFETVLALFVWLVLLFACLCGVYSYIYAPDYHCPQCHLIFKTKRKRYFT